MAKTSRKKMEYDMKYAAKSIRQFNLKLNRNTDSDMVAYLEAQPNIQGYIKGLVETDMKEKTYYVIAIGKYDEWERLKTHDLSDARKFARHISDSSDPLEIRIYKEDIEDEDCTCFDYDTIEF